MLKFKKSDVYKKSSRKELIKIEKDAIIECLQAELETLKKEHSLLVMKRTKQLCQLGTKGIGEEIYKLYGIAFMEAKLTNEQTIPSFTNYSPSLDFVSCLKIIK